MEEVVQTDHRPSAANVGKTTGFYTFIVLLHICLLFYHTQLKLYLYLDRSNAKVQAQLGPKLQCENFHIILRKPIEFCRGLGTGVFRTPCE